MEQNVVLRVENLTKKYRGKTVLDGVSFELKKGSATALVGSNGSGKTTLMRIVAGLVVPDRGTVSLFGSQNDRELRKARQKTGFLIEAPIYYGYMPVKKNLKLRAGLYGGAAEEYIEELCRRLKLTEYDVGRGRTSLLSYGQKGRYAIASTLVGKPELLILDEPFNGLDDESTVLVYELFRELREKHGVTLLLSGHVAEQIQQVCTDTLIIKDGVMSTGEEA